MGPLIGIIVTGCQMFSQRGKEATNEQLSRQTYGEKVTVAPNQTKPNHAHAYWFNQIKFTDELNDVTNSFKMK